MQLTEKEAKILSCVEWDADKQISEIASETHLQDRTVRYHLRSLEERGIIQRTPFFDLNSLGYHYVGIFFSVGSVKQSMETVSKCLLESPQVVWWAELSGDYQYGLGLCVRHLRQVQEFLFQLATRFPGLFYEKSVSTQFSYVRYRRHYLNQQLPSDGLVLQTTEVESQQIDDLDRRILHCMAYDRPKSRRELSRVIGTPLSTVDKRVRKLHEKGIIVRYMYDLDVRAIGMETYTIMIYSNGFQREFHIDLHQFAAAHPNIVEVYSCFGSWDYELNIEVSNAAVVPEICRELKERYSNVLATLKTVRRFRDLKSSLLPF